MPPLRQPVEVRKLSFFNTGIKWDLEQTQAQQQVALVTQMTVSIDKEVITQDKEMKD